MYVPSHFEERRPEVLHQFMRDHAFALLITLGEEGLEANSIPWLLDLEGPQPVLRGHLARANPVWRNARTETEALVVFQGADAYVTPSWYPSKQEHGKVVPTWNFMTVHARGPLTFHPDPEWIRTNVTALTQRYEAARPAPWTVEDAPADFLEKLLTAVVGVEIRVSALQGKWKLSQNRPLGDREGVAQGLEAEGAEKARALAEQIKHGLSKQL